MNTTLNVEALDLAQVAAFLRRSFGLEPIVGAVVGRTQIRDAVAQHLECSQLEAEIVVDTMVARGFLVQREPSPGLAAWTIVEGSRS